MRVTTLTLTLFVVACSVATGEERDWVYKDKLIRGEFLRFNNNRVYLKTGPAAAGRLLILKPWDLSKADQRWYRDYFVASVILRELQKLELSLPSQ